MIEETSISFGPNGALVGTLSIPTRSVGPVGVILLNAGVVHRVGPHRINVRLARRLAKKGVASIRFDLAGQGDSERSISGIGYQEQAVADIQAAMDVFEEKNGTATFGVFGFCSGAHHGFRAALADDRIKGLLIYDAFLYATLKSRLNHYLFRARQHGLAKAIFRRLLRAWNSVGSKDKVVPNNKPAVGFNTGLAKNEFAVGTSKLVNRGVQICIINSGSFEIYNYASQFHDAFSRFEFSRKIETQFIPDLNHTATMLAMQSNLLFLAEQWAVELNSAKR